MANTPQDNETQRSEALTRRSVPEIVINQKDLVERAEGDYEVEVSA